MAGPKPLLTFAFIRESCAYYLSFGTLGFEISPSAGLHWRRENDGPLMAMAEKWAIIPYPLALNSCTFKGRFALRLNCR